MAELTIFLWHQRKKGVEEATQRETPIGVIISSIFVYGLLYFSTIQQL
jgi:hypothetical protein